MEWSIVSRRLSAFVQQGSGNSILSGDNCKIEGSIVVLFMNLILTESSKSPASIAKSNKQWVGLCEE